MRKPLFCLLFSLAFVFMLSLLSVYESGDLPFCTVPYSGLISQGHPINLHFYTASFILAEGYMGLYAVAPYVPWYAIILYLYLALSLFAILLSMHGARVGVFSKLKRFCYFFTCLVLMAEPILLLQYTRVAFMLGVASTMLLIAYPPSGRFKIVSFIFMVFCVLTRWESGVLVVIIQWIYVFIFTDRREYWKTLVANTMAVSLLLGYIAYDKFATHDFIHQFQPELGYQLIDRGNIVPLATMKNGIDSMKYVAVQNLISDPDFITIKFLRSLVRVDSYVGLDADLALRAARIMYENVKEIFGLFVIYLGILFFISTAEINNRRYKQCLKLIFFNLIIWSIMFLIAYLIKMETRLIGSLITFVSFIHLFLYTRTSYLRISGYSVFAWIITLFGLIFFLKDTTRNMVSLNKDITRNAGFLALAKEKCKGKIVVPSLNNTESILATVSPLRMPDYSEFSRIYLFDADVMHVVKNYNAYLNKECQCESADYIAFMDFLHSKKDNVVFLGDAARVSLIRDYCSIVRGREYNFQVSDSISTDREICYIWKFKD